MKTDIQAQLAEYGRFHRDEQRPVDLAEITRDRPAVRVVPPSNKEPKLLRRGRRLTGTAAVRRGGHGPVRPLRHLEPRSRDRRVALAAAAVMVAAVGGIAWLFSISGDDVDPADQPTVTTMTVAPTTAVPEPPNTFGTLTPLAPVSTTSVPSFPPPGPLPPTDATGEETLSGAMTAISGGNPHRFLLYLADDGELVFDDGTRQKWSEVAIDYQRTLDNTFAPGVSWAEATGVDFDGELGVTYAEALTIAAYSLGFDSAEIIDCTRAGDGERCVVYDPAPFHRAYGVEVAPIEVLIQNGRLVEVTVGWPPGPPTASQPIGGCLDPCDAQEMRDTFLFIADSYMAWLDVAPEEGHPAVEPRSALALGGGVSFSLIGASGEEPPRLDFVHPSGIAHHSDLIPQWLAEFNLTEVIEFTDAFDQYVAGLLRGHPEPLFDTTALGEPQPIVGTVEHDTRSVNIEVRGVNFSVRLDWADDGRPLVRRSAHGRTSTPGNTQQLASLLGLEPYGGIRSGQLVIGGLSPDVAVVVTVLSDGTRTWQQPFGGSAVLEVDRNDAHILQLLDADGNVTAALEVFDFTARQLESP